MGDLISRASHISISRNKSDLLHRRAKSERSGMNNPLSGRSPDRTHESIRLKIRRRRETLAQRATLLFGELMRTRKVDQSVPESGFRSLGPLGRRIQGRIWNQLWIYSRYHHLSGYLLLSYTIGKTPYSPHPVRSIAHPIRLLTGAIDFYFGHSM